MAGDERHRRHDFSRLMQYLQQSPFHKPITKLDVNWNRFVKGSDPHNHSGSLRTTNHFKNERL